MTLTNNLMKTPRPLLLFACTITLLVRGPTLAAQPELAATSPTVELLSPTGKLPIARTSYHWIDASRVDASAQVRDAKRELMVHIWYPAQPRPVNSPAKYQPDISKIQAVLGEANLKQGAGPAYAALFSARTHVTTDADVSPQSSSYPVLLLTHGLGVNVMFYSMLAEDLATHGYIVVGIDHPHTAIAVVFPDGRSVPYAEQEWREERTPDEDLAFKRKSNDRCAADFTFVLNELQKLNSGAVASRFKGRLDLTRVGALGHSIGGRVVGRACQLDQRIKAGLGLDGEPLTKKFDQHPDGSTLQQPFMNIRPANPIPTDEELAQGNTTRKQWDQQVRERRESERAFYESVKGGGYDVVVNVPEMNHSSFSDGPLLESGHSEETMTNRRRAMEVTRLLTHAFFERHLGARRTTLIDDHSSRPKEVGLTIYKFAEQLESAPRRQ